MLVLRLNSHLPLVAQAVHFIWPTKQRPAPTAKTPPMLEDSHASKLVHVVRRLYIVVETVRRPTIRVTKKFALSPSSTPIPTPRLVFTTLSNMYPIRSLDSIKARTCMIDRKATHLSFSSTPFVSGKRMTLITRTRPRHQASTPVLQPALNPFVGTSTGQLHAKASFHHGGLRRRSKSV